MVIIFIQDIVFFGENLPDNFYRLHEIDLLSADLVLVMGTSLEVCKIIKIKRFSYD